jgi:hypothetical protein
MVESSEALKENGLAVQSDNPKVDLKENHYADSMVELKDFPVAALTVHWSVVSTDE